MMLEGLEKIAWGELGHAYGTAEDVPMWILALTSPDEEKRKTARGEFWSSVIHQGTVYSVTSYVVPFLVELLSAPEVPDKAEILGLLAAFAEGASYHDAHYELDKASGIYGDAIDSPEWHAKIQEELGWVGAAHLAVVHGAPVYLEVLKNNGDPEVRIAATYTLSTCFERAEEILPVLIQLGAIEREPSVRASCLFAAAQLAKRKHNPAPLNLAQKILQEPDLAPLVQAVAALILVRAMGDNAPDSVITSLLERLKDPAPVDTAFRALPWSEYEGFVSAAGVALLPLGERTAPLLIPVLLDAIRQREGERSHSEVQTMAQVVLVACGFEVRNPDPYDQERIRAVPSEITPLQRKTLLRLSNYEQPWRWGEVIWMLRKYGLPEKPEEIRTFLEGDALFESAH